MFYCEDCRKKKKWPESFHRSFGTCEICGIRRSCHDVKSKDLPEKK